MKKKKKGKKNMLKWAIKKYLVGKINSLLASRKSDVESVGHVLSRWIGRLERLLSLFRSVLAKLDDGSLDADELDQTLSEVESVIREW